jgi:divalent metal cation (Fe/Co/Zn/Cd) transporter
MTALAFAKQRVGREMGSRALVADSEETWVRSYLSLTLSLGVGAYAVVGWWWADPVVPRDASGHPLAGMGEAG